MATFTKTALGLALVGSWAATQAAPITGVITFAGIGLVNNANSAIATQVTIIAPSVISVSGDFTPPVTVGQTPAITSPLVLGATPAVVWSLDGFTFTPNAPLSGGGGPNNTFAIGTTGIIDDGPGGFDPTPASFSLTATPVVAGFGAFASITAAPPLVPVPDSGSTFALLGGALLGVVAFRRR